jgi:hypothetical protein
VLASRKRVGSIGQQKRHHVLVSMPRRVVQRSFALSVGFVEVSHMPACDNSTQFAQIGSTHTERGGEVWYALEQEMDCGQVPVGTCQVERGNSCPIRSAHQASTILIRCRLPTGKFGREETSTTRLMRQHA